MTKANRHKKNITYNYQGRTPENLEKIKERERIIKERQAKIDICLNCKRECKYGICEFFPHG